MRCLEKQINLTFIRPSTDVCWEKNVSLVLENLSLSTVYIIRALLFVIYILFVSCIEINIIIENLYVSKTSGQLFCPPSILWLTLFNMYEYAVIYYNLRSQVQHFSYYAEHKSSDISLTELELPSSDFVDIYFLIHTIKSDEC